MGSATFSSVCLTTLPERNLLSKVLERKAPDSLDTPQGGSLHITHFGNHGVNHQFRIKLCSIPCDLLADNVASNLPVNLPGILLHLQLGYRGRKMVSWSLVRPHNMTMPRKQNKPPTTLNLFGILCHRLSLYLSLS